MLLEGHLHLDLVLGVGLRCPGCILIPRVLNGVILRMSKGHEDTNVGDFYISIPSAPASHPAQKGYPAPDMTHTGAP